MLRVRASWTAVGALLRSIAPARAFSVACTVFANPRVLCVAQSSHLHWRAATSSHHHRPSRSQQHEPQPKTHLVRSASRTCCRPPSYPPSHTRTHTKPNQPHSRGHSKRTHPTTGNLARGQGKKTRGATGPLAGRTKNEHPVKPQVSHKGVGISQSTS